jgi:hypothetical protein
MFRPSHRPEDGPAKGPKHVVFSLNTKAPSNITVPFMLGDESIEDVESFVYLGSKVTKDGGTT